MNDCYKEKLVVLTGGAGGIGTASAVYFLNGGADVLLIDVDEAKLEQAAATLPHTDRVKILASDLSTPEKCGEALDVGGRPVYALVHFAGIFVPDLSNPAENRTVYDKTIAVNQTTAYDMAFAFETRCVKDEPARLIFISSLAFRRGALDHVAYTMSKGALTGLVRALARRFAPDILVNGLAPGIILTTMPSGIIATRGDRLPAEIPLARYGEPEEVAGVVDFLSGPNATYMTGQILNVDGGIVNS